MNGLKRASRRQAAVVGLAVLMGASFLGCHAGPRLFSKKDRGSQADKQELAEKDKGKFINRKKARPESEYRRDDGSDERVAKSDPKAKPKPSDTIRKSSTNDASRAVAARKPVDDEPQAATRSLKATTAPSKSTKQAEQPQFARKDTAKRPVTDLLKDSMFEDELPESLPSAPPPTAKKSVTKPTTTTKTKTIPADEDPFKNSIVSSSKPIRPIEKVAPVNFDHEDLDLGLDDEAAEEAEELAEAKALAAKKSAASAKVAATALVRRPTQTAAAGQQKFLEVFDEESGESSPTVEQDLPAPKTADKPRASQPAVKRPAAAAKTVAGQDVIDRRQNVQQTVKDWRRDFERDELLESDEEPIAPTPRTAARPSSASPSRGHLSPTTLDEFAPPTKSQGATLNGELIIDTSSLPSRFQRSSTSPAGANSSNGATGRINTNSSANIEIVPGATQNRGRSAGQISLQSLSDQENSSGLTTADYEQPSTPDDLGGLPALKIESDSESGPKLAALEFDSGIAPPPPDMGELVPAISVTELPSGTRGWKRALLAFSALASAVGIGLALRKRNQMTAVPAVVPKFSHHMDGRPHDLEQWPRG